MYNRVLDNSQRIKYEKIMNKFKTSLPNEYGRKIADSLVQHAMAYDYITKNFVKDDKLLCAGSYEDICCALLKKEGWDIVEVDPAQNYDLDTYVTQYNNGERFDCVFSISVIEHVEKDRDFFERCVELLKFGGALIITMDHNDNKPFPVISGDFRFYTDELIKELIKDSGIALIDGPEWTHGPTDFKFGGFEYTFASVVGIKEND